MVQLSNLIASIDSTIVNVSLPSITEDTHADLSTAQWVITGYLITVMIGLLITGRLADILGRKRVFIQGFILFTAGSLFCGAAPDCRWLIVARIIQAIGAASLLANANPILTNTFQGAERGLALGLNSTIVAAGYALGFVLGGVLSEYTGWRSIFYVNVPVGIVAVLLCRSLLAPDPEGFDREGLRQFDWKGSILSCIGLGCTLFSLDRLAGSPRFEYHDLALLIVGLIAFGLFIASQFRIRNPLVHLELFRLQNVSVGLSCLFCFTATLASCSFVFPFFLQGILELEPSKTGLVLMPYSLALSIVAPFTGWLTARMHPGWMSCSGFLLGAGVSLSYMELSASSSFWWVAVGQFGLGLSGATFLSPNRVVVLSTVPEKNLGEASALIQVIRFFGLSIGTLMASLIFHDLMDDFGGVAQLLKTRGSDLVDAAFIHGIQVLFSITAFLMILGAAACAWNVRHQAERKTRAQSAA